MQEFNITIKISKKQTISTKVEAGTTFKALANRFQSNYEVPIVLAKMENKLWELDSTIEKEGVVTFITMSDRDGKRAYRRSVTMLLQKAVSNLWEHAMVKVRYSLGNGYYCEMEGVKPEADNICRLKAEMLRLAEKDIPITKETVKTDTARELFAKMGMEGKERLMEYRRSSRVNLCNLDGMVDYFYGYMVPSTGYLKWFDLELFEEGFLLLFPGKGMEIEEKRSEFEKLFLTMKESKEWSSMLGVGTVGALNEAISQGRGNEMILLQEALMEERIGALAARIAEDKNKKFIMIAGPSSSGKTTFSNRLSIQLTAKGLRPHAIGLDDYYADRHLCPKDEDGNYDFECLEALDVELFNKDMTRLLAGEEINLPTFNFKTGLREYRGRKLKLGENDILVIEGIHGLNSKLSCSLPEESKFRIYISALTQLNIDEHNPLPTTDGRLLRRIVRDARTRNTSAKDTLAMWHSVRRGEEKYIFPFQESADVMFNSALVYELSVLKTYAEPLLFQIPRDCEEYLEAKRLLKLLDYFLPLPTEGIANNSLAREFIGGSCFHV
uniref:nucleoside kinase n=1 Tax=Agathobacter sp. TaxID=2021311 RepID=UPI004055E0B2